jgi:hypothetical protein
MAGLKFLGGQTKVVICVIGMALMGYYLYPSIQEGFVADGVTILRVMVFVGFAFFLVKNLQAIFTGSGDSRDSS